MRSQDDKALLEANFRAFEGDQLSEFALRNDMRFRQLPDQSRGGGRRLRWELWFDL